MNSKKCSGCKKEKSIDLFGKHSDCKGGYNSKCLACISEINKKYRQRNKERINKKGRERRKNLLISKKCSICSKQVLPDSNIFCEDCYLKTRSRQTLGSLKFWKLLKEKLQNQNFKCAYTQEDLIIGRNASIDHIKPVFKYPELSDNIDNIQWVTKEMNWFKSKFTEEELFYYCSKILNTLNKK